MVVNGTYVVEVDYVPRTGSSSMAFGVTAPHTVLLRSYNYVR